MHCGVLECGGDLGEIHGVLPDHLLAFLQFDATNVFAGGDLQVLVEQRSEIAGTHIHLLRNQGHRKLLPHVRADILLRPPNDLVFIMYRVAGPKPLWRFSLGSVLRDQHKT